MTTPGWLDDELADEWVDQPPADDNYDDHGAPEAALNTSLAVVGVPHGGSVRATSGSSAGTVVVREDMPVQPILALAKTPGRPGKVKDFFSPLPLQSMFEPPTPPDAYGTPAATLPGMGSRFSTSPLEQVDEVSEREVSERDFEGDLTVSETNDFHSYQPHDHVAYESDATEEDDIPHPDEILETDIPNLAGFDGRKPSRAFQFTFNVPVDSESTPARPSPSPAAPLTDPRLRLFQFQYDTYTREHLSAMVDSIAGAGGTTGTHPRSTKRIRLSPESESPRKPRDYLRDSKSLMAQIKEARSFTMNTHDSPAAQPLSPPREDDEEEEPDMDQLAAEANIERQVHTDGQINENGKRSTYSSLAYRKQADALMARIKSDMHKKRLISAATVVSNGGNTTVTAPNSPEKRTPILSKRNSIHVEDKENDPQPTLTLTRTRPKPSPRKLLRRLSAADEVDRELALQNLSLIDHFPQQQIVVANVGTPAVVVQAFSPKPFIPHMPSVPNSPAPRAAPGLLHPTGSARNLDDLNRFVSSSTAASSAATSTGSCIKHAGPPTMTRIAPSDLPPLPERVGAMVFDKASNRWVKNVPVDDDDGDHSEDPFRDIESLHSSRTGEDEDVMEDELATERYDVQNTDRTGPRFVDVESGSSFTDDEDLGDDDMAPVQVMTGVDTDTDLDTTLEWDIAESITHPATETLQRRPSPFDTRSPMPSRAPPSFIGVGPSRARAAAAAPAPGSSRWIESANPGPSRGFIPAPPAPAPATLPAPTPSPIPAPVQQVAPTPIRGSNVTPVVPRSVLKSTPVAGIQTPLGSGVRTHRRSVSFSDGRKDGKIRGLLSDESNTTSSTEGDKDNDNIDVAEGGRSMSMRSKRILDKFEALEDPTWEIDTPSKASTGMRESLTTRNVQTHAQTADASSSSRRGLQRSSSVRPSANANATFLTECSFAVAHDRLVTVITDVQPYEPYWEELVEIDLSNKNVESLARLKEFLPKIEHLNIDSNRVEWLTGVPKTLRSLTAVNNLLTSLTSFNHLLKLERLDLSHNQFDSVHQLSCLVALRELNVEGNEIESISGLEPLVALEKLNLRGNKLRELDLGEVSWARIESLDVSKNSLRSVSGLEILKGSLASLNLDGNKLTTLNDGGHALSMPKLRILRASDNALQRLEVGGMPALRTLYVDGNKLREGLADLYGLDRLRRLENLSLRNQDGVAGKESRSQRVLPSKDIRDVKRLYLSANPLPLDFLQEACYNMVYLELAACRLEQLPPELAQLVPNLRVLNLNYNFLSDVSALAGLTRLRKLTVIGSRLTSVKGVIRILRGMPDIEMVDFRMNPFSLGWYLPLLVRDVPGALQPSEKGSKERRVGMGSTWEELDRKFRGDLPDGSYVGRLAYRGLVMGACRGVQEIDGVVVRSEERVKAAALLSGVQAKKNLQASGL
ncbi:L domain-like protein [Exidia glandulosa HHB12029]|uniref:L domain-like protein n=1 Tax=Exidia glandulosa HHB12029 TaxID=1314781 RepID=A0A165ING7_EXIGL|nr:L domain-like protein [Exidia glandulosa HHB12029]